LRLGDFVLARKLLLLRGPQSLIGYKEGGDISMNSFRLALVLLVLTTMNCAKQTTTHPWVEPGMHRAKVLEIMGTPIRIDSLFHDYGFDLRGMTIESLDSLRRTVDDSLAHRMTLGYPVDHSHQSDQFVTWYYGPEIIDTMFTIDREGTAPSPLRKVWFAIRKQRAVVFDMKGGIATELGFRVLHISPL